MKRTIIKTDGNPTRKRGRSQMTRRCSFIAFDSGDLESCFQRVESASTHSKILAVLLLCLASSVNDLMGADYSVEETSDKVHIETPHLKASINKEGYVTGVYRNTFLDKKTGFRDLGFGLDIVDWIMEPGSDEAYRDQLDDELVYRFGNDYHGKTPKRSIEGPQICTRAKTMQPEIIRGENFVAIKQQFRYKTSAPGKKTGSLWTQYLVFPNDTRYFISMDRIDALNSSEEMFLRIDMPGHIKHDRGDSFSEIYLSYKGKIPSSEFTENFAPDEKFNFQRKRDGVPERVIRGYHIREPKSGKDGPWLVGMTLAPEMVSTAWCHQRNYVCMIEEFGGYPVKAGESFSAAFIVGYFDSVEEMNLVYDRYKGAKSLEVTEQGWKLIK